MYKWLTGIMLALLIFQAAGCTSGDDDVTLFVDEHVAQSDTTLVVTRHGDTGQLTSAYLSEADVQDLVDASEIIDIHLVEVGDNEFVVETCAYLIAAHERDLVCLDFAGCGGCYDYLDGENAPY